MHLLTGNSHKMTDNLEATKTANFSIADDASLTNRKDLLQSTTKFTNENLNSLTLCNARSTPLVKEGRREIKHLNLLNYKVSKCTNADCNDFKSCLYYHTETDRRRNMVNHKYVSDLCNFIAKGSHCQQGDKCKYAHNHFESLYHPSKYKKRFCNLYPDSIDQCKYGKFCSYAHSEEEITIPLLHNLVFDQDFYLFHYKTQLCPFSFVSHNRSTCVYAHNWQDMRRNPAECITSPYQCQNWREKSFLQHYSDGCPYGSRCEYSHGWKEAEFHPLSYKRGKCDKKNCQKRSACPLFHDGLGDKR